MANKFKENEKIIQKLGIQGTTLVEVNEELDNLETVTKALSVDVYKAKKLSKTGETLMMGKLHFVISCMLIKYFQNTLSQRFGWNPTVLNSEICVKSKSLCSWKEEVTCSSF